MLRHFTFRYFKRDSFFILSTRCRRFVKEEAMKLETKTPLTFSALSPRVFDNIN